MGHKRKAHRTLKAAIRSWLWPILGEKEVLGKSALQQGPPSVQTELSATVFSGGAGEWVRYLQTPRLRRYEHGIGVRVYVQPELDAVVFDPESDDSQWLADLLGVQFRALREHLRSKPNVLAVLNGLIFDNSDNRTTGLCVRLSPTVPSDGTRETARGAHDPSDIVALVFNSHLAKRVRQLLAEASAGTSTERRLGLAWPLLVRLIYNLAYPAAPRDLFVTKIDVHAKMSYVAVNTLYTGMKAGKLLPNAAGRVYEQTIADLSGLTTAALDEHHPYFRALNKLGFMLRAGAYTKYEEDARIVSREFLDTSYLRLSLAGAMPPIRRSMRPSVFQRKGPRVRTSAPEVGRYGIVDSEDFEAWKMVAAPFGDLGFTLLRQLGIGEFGRVYEALNGNNPNFPEHVALKVDRIVGKKKKAILEAEEAMKMGRQLAGVPHVIRLYDTGKLSGKRYTFHVLQLIDGETLDNLVGVTGREHASVSRPPSSLHSEQEARTEYQRAVDSHATELWRRRGESSPFTQALSPAMVLDLLTSVLLWLEEVHQLGYASNDLKNGNLMMSRRGQFKGIDLDSYTSALSPKDKMIDFMFLAVSLILLLFNAPVTDRGRIVPWEKLIENESKLRSGLGEAWPFGDVDSLSEGRVSHEELTNVFVDLIQRSRKLVYTREPHLFTSDIARLVDMKRRLLIEEFVID